MTESATECPFCQMTYDRCVCELDIKTKNREMRKPDVKEN